MSWDSSPLLPESPASRWLCVISDTKKMLQENCVLWIVCRFKPFSINAGLWRMRRMIWQRCPLSSRLMQSSQQRMHRGYRALQWPVHRSRLLSGKP